MTSKVAKKRPNPSVSIFDTRTWSQWAACRDASTELFIQSHHHKQARDVCLDCPVATNCFFEAVESEVEGTWGGVFFPSRFKPTKGRRSEVDRRDSLISGYRASLAAEMGLNRTQFIRLYGESVYGIRTALRDARRRRRDVRGK